MDLSALANLGALGVILGYVLTQIGPRLDRLDRTINRLARAQMLTLLKMSEDSVMHDQVLALLRELDPDGDYDLAARNSPVSASPR